MANIIHKKAQELGLIFIALWGSWYLYYWIFTYGFNASFNDVINYAPILLGLVIVVLTSLWLFKVRIHNPRASNISTPEYSTDSVDGHHLAIPPSQLLIAGLLPAAIILASIIIKFPYSYLLAWLSVAASLLLIAWNIKSIKVSGYPQVNSTLASVIEITSFISVIVGVLYVTSATIRPDADDAYYVNIIANALTQSHLPLQNADVLLNTSSGEPIHAGYRASGYEIAIAFTARMLSTDYMTLYYNIFPAVNALAWLTFAYLFFTNLGIRFPWVTVAFTFLIILIWGGNHYSFGNFAFVRIFQGKSVVAMLAVPAIFYFTHAYIRAPRAINWALLLLSLTAITGFSSTGLIIIPVTFAFALLIHMKLTIKGIKSAFIASLALTPVLVILLANMYAVHINPIPSGVSSGDLEFAGAAFGNIDLKLLILLLLAWLPLGMLLTTGRQESQTVLRLAFVALVTVFNPLFIKTLVAISGVNLLSWRLQWAFPSEYLPGILAATVTVTILGLLHRDWQRLKWNNLHLPILLTGAFLFWLVLFALRTSPTMAASPNPLTNIGQPKIPSTYLQESLDIRSLLPQTGAFVVAGVAEEILPRLENPPTFVSVRHYLDFYDDKVDTAELKKRRALHTLVRQLHPIIDENETYNAQWAAQASRELNVTSVIFSAGKLTTGPMASYDADPEFIESLISQLIRYGYKCTLTATRNTHVCNIKPDRQ